MTEPLAPLPFLEAIAWARSRRVVLPEVYYGQLHGLARAQAFTISGLARLDQIQGVADRLTAALESGETFGAWQARVIEEQQLIELAPARMETIFRNAIQQAYNRGRYEQQARVVDDFPWYMYDAVNDSRTRPAHAAMDGMVARHDDPIWDTWTPACGHRCRCRRVALTERQAARMQAEDQKRMADDPDLARVRVTARPDPGWGQNIYRDPNAGLRRAIAQRQAACAGHGGQLSAMLARRGGCLIEASRLLEELRSNLDRDTAVEARDRALAHLGVAAVLAANAEHFATVWRSPAHYRRHLAKRIERGHVSDAPDYVRQIMRTLEAPSVLLLATSPSHPGQIAVESDAWAIIYQGDTLTTAYRKEGDEESFLARRLRLHWRVLEVSLDEETRDLLRQLRAHYGRLR